MSWICLLWALGCGTPTAPAEDDSDAVFPHAEGFIREHPEVAKRDDAPCANCHQLALVNDSAEGPFLDAPPCDVCHPYAWGQSQEAARQAWSVGSWFDVRRLP